MDSHSNFLLDLFAFVSVNTPVLRSAEQVVSQVV